MNSPKVSVADRIGVEKVEKNSAIAVTIESSTKMSATAFSTAGSSTGASSVLIRLAGPTQRMHASTKYKATAITERFTASVKTNPTYLPRTI